VDGYLGPAEYLINFISPLVQLELYSVKDIEIHSLDLEVLDNLFIIFVSASANQNKLCIIWKVRKSCGPDSQLQGVIFFWTELGE